MTRASLDRLEGLLTTLALALALAAVAGWLALVAGDLLRMTASAPRRHPAALPRSRARVAAALLGSTLTGVAGPAVTAHATPVAVSAAPRAAGPVSPDLATEPTASGSPEPTASSSTEPTGSSRTEPTASSSPAISSTPTASATSAPPATAAPVDPDLRVEPQPPGPALRPAVSEPDHRRHVVLRGESLWTIAAAQLPAGAGDAEVARACHELYAANHQMIGPDPDRILPGQVLDIPVLTTPGKTVP